VTIRGFREDLGRIEGDTILGLRFEIGIGLIED
jgi:hypothetical protein